jgi:hypothetical protein
VFITTATLFLSLTLIGCISYTGVILFLRCKSAEDMCIKH